MYGAHAIGNFGGRAGLQEFLRPLEVVVTHENPRRENRVSEEPPGHPMVILSLNHVRNLSGGQ